MDFDFKTNGTATTKGHANAPKDPTDLWSLITIISYVTLAFLLPIIGMIIANSISTGKGGTDPKGSSKSSSKKKNAKTDTRNQSTNNTPGFNDGKGMGRPQAPFGSQRQNFGGDSYNGGSTFENGLSNGGERFRGGREVREAKDMGFGRQQTNMGSNSDRFGQGRGPSSQRGFQDQGYSNRSMGMGGGQNGDPGMDGQARSGRSGLNGGFMRL